MFPFPITPSCAQQRGSIISVCLRLFVERIDLVEEATGLVRLHLITWRRDIIGLVWVDLLVALIDLGHRSITLHALLDVVALLVHTVEGERVLVGRRRRRAVLLGRQEL